MVLFKRINTLVTLQPQPSEPALQSQVFFSISSSIFPSSHSDQIPASTIIFYHINGGVKMMCSVVFCHTFFKIYAKTFSFGLIMPEHLPPHVCHVPCMANMWYWQVLIPHLCGINTCDQQLEDVGHIFQLWPTGRWMSFWLSFKTGSLLNTFLKVYS